MSQKIIITGANGGFGKLTVKTLLEAGHKVTATMRDITGRNQAAANELSDKGAIVVEMDVTDNKSVDTAMAEAIDAMGGLDVVINNAGRGVSGMIEHFTPEDYQALFDINVFGVQRVNRAALPFLRKQGNGTIINISSLLGRITLPFYGPYNATKWALEAMTENYRTELSGFGIQSLLVEPGGFPTTFMASLMTPSDNSRDAEYGEFMNVPTMAGANFEEVLKNTPEQDPQKVADEILNLIDTPTADRPFKTIVDFMPWKDGIQQYNDAMDGLTNGIYSAVQMDGMLKVQSN